MTRTIQHHLSRNLPAALCTAGLAFAVLAPSTAAASTIVTHTDRTNFRTGAGPVRTETFNQITSDIDLATPYDGGEFTMANHRPYGSYGSSLIDAGPFGQGTTTIDGTTHIVSSVYNFSDAYSSLKFTFDSAITAFGANFISGSSGGIEMLVDGVLVQGRVASGGFFGLISDTAFTTLELRARPGSGYGYSVDNVTFSTSAVPEPATWALMIGGFMFIGAVMRRRGPAPALRHV